MKKAQIPSDETTPKTSLTGPCSSPRLEALDERDPMPYIDLSIHFLSSWAENAICNAYERNIGATG